MVHVEQELSDFGAEEVYAQELERRGQNHEADLVRQNRPSRIVDRAALAAMRRVAHSPS